MARVYVRTLAGLVVLIASCANAVLSEQDGGWVASAYAQDTDWDEESSPEDESSDETAATSEAEPEDASWTADESEQGQDAEFVDESPADDDGGFIEAGEPVDDDTEFAQDEPVDTMDDFAVESEADDSAQFDSEASEGPGEDSSDMAEDDVAEESIAKGPAAPEQAPSTPEGDTEDGMEDDFADLTEEDAPPPEEPPATPAPAAPVPVAPVPVAPAPVAPAPAAPAPASRQEAERKLREFEQKARSELAEMQAGFQEANAKFIEEVQTGRLPPLDQEERQTKLQEMLREGAARELALNIELQQKRCDLEGVSNADCSKLIDAVKNPPIDIVNVAFAEFISSGKVVGDNCEAELRKHCLGLSESGNVSVFQCLSANEATNSPACNAALNRNEELLQRYHRAREAYVNRNR